MSGRMRPSSPGIRLAILCVVLLNGWLCLHFIRDKIHRNGSQDVVRNVNNYWTGSSAINSTMVAITEDTTPVLIEPQFPCQNSIPHPYHWQTGTYHILFNYVLADSQFRCDESITYTTHGDFTFLDNLEPLTQRWKGPVSIAMFAPGSDFTRTLEAIQYARECFSEEVRQLVTFHLVLPEHHQPEIKGLIPNRENILSQMYILCVLNYELNVLDNAFLVHRPGIKSKSAHTTRRTVASKQTHIIRSVIIPELNAIYGTKKECSV